MFGYDPVRDVPRSLIDEAAQEGVPGIFGIWERNGAMRVGVVSCPFKSDRTCTLVGVKAAPLRPWSSIRNDRKMA